MTGQDLPTTYQGSGAGCLEAMLQVRWVTTVAPRACELWVPVVGPCVPVCGLRVLGQICFPLTPPVEGPGSPSTSHTLQSQWREVPVGQRWALASSSCTRAPKSHPPRGGGPALTDAHPKLTSSHTLPHIHSHFHPHSVLPAAILVPRYI